LCRLAALLAVLTVATAGSALQQPGGTASSGESSYCAEMEKYARAHPQQVLDFSAQPQNRDPARDHWLPVNNEDDFRSKARNGDSTAEVIERNGNVVFARFTYQNQFGDSVEHAQYCFRQDGSLAQLDSEFDSYHGNMKIVRGATYSQEGRRLSHFTHSFDLSRGTPKPMPPDFWDLPAPVFLHTRDLPFAAYIPKAAPPPR
jgi:hypothetical protein